jgi:hypothetical protein
MKPFIRLVAVTAVALVGTATLAAAAETPYLLNKLELQKRVAAETPIANLRLAVHFKALAADYDAEAARSRAAAAVFTATANRSVTTNAGRHYAAQSVRASEWAAAARELAAYHLSLAAGRAAVVPRGAGALHAGRGAPEPTAEQLHQLALRARTRTDHLELQEYYEVVARKKTAEAERHVRMAMGYLAGVRNGLCDQAATRDRLAGLARKAARTATEAANRHRVLATVA